MSYASIDDLRSQLGASRTPEQSAAYAAKMLHAIPEAPVVDRVDLILDRCTGRRVLEFGASGSLTTKIRSVASSYQGVDRSASDQILAFDLDDVSQTTLPAYEADVIICGEVLEHLGNPAWFLTRLRRQYPTTPVVITVPNAFGAQHSLRRGIENVNIDHVAWYSFTTLKTLLRRVGYREFWFAWYHGKPLTAEGLILVVE